MPLAACGTLWSQIAVLWSAPPFQFFFKKCFLQKRSASCSFSPGPYSSFPLPPTIYLRIYLTTIDTRICDLALDTLEASFGVLHHSLRLLRGFRGRSGRGQAISDLPAIPLHLQEETWVRLLRPSRSLLQVFLWNGHLLDYVPDGVEKSLGNPQTHNTFPEAPPWAVP